MHWQGPEQNREREKPQSQEPTRNEEVEGRQASESPRIETFHDSPLGCWAVLEGKVTLLDAFVTPISWVFVGE
jgi:hypothetical protein